MRRPQGSGSVVQHHGRWRARLPHRWGRRSLGVYDTAEEAHAILDAALAELDKRPPHGMTVGGWGDQVLERRAAGHHKRRTVERDRDRWRAYVAGSKLGRLPLISVEERDVRRWLEGVRKVDGSRPAPTTLSNALSLVRTVLEAGREAGRIPTNPARDVRLSVPARRRATVSGRGGGRWTWLREDEIARVLGCDDLPLRSRAAYALAIYGGLRAGEIWGLRWSDIDFGRGVIHVRHSFEDTPKAHQIREVPMLAPAREWLTSWRRAFELAGVRSRIDLVWPSRSELWHSDGYDAGWATRHRARAGIRPEVRFHDLRHTCASHLLQGTWAPRRVPLVYWIDRPLRLEEVRDWLGHDDIGVTQRYAHLSADAVRQLVVQPGHGGTRVGHDIEPPIRFERTTYGLRKRADGTGAEAEAVGSGPRVPAVSHPEVEHLRALAVRYARALEQGDLHRDQRGLDLVEAVLDLAAEVAAEASPEAATG
jgi:integrase